MKVKFITLGCKVNQYESEAMLELLLREGFQEAADGEEADVVVVNSCTVTATGDQKARQALRRAKKQNPGRTNKYFVNFFFIGKYTCPLRRPQSAASVQFFVPYGIYISNTACTSPTS